MTSVRPAIRSAAGPSAGASGTADDMCGSAAGPSAGASGTADDMCGSAAPDFELRDQHGQAVRLSGLRGRPVLLVFYPYAFTGVCTGELGVLRDEFSGADAPAVVLAVSCDTTFALRVFAEQESLEFAMLSDFWPHGSVAKAYGVFDAERGCPLRGTFIIDADGVVAWSVVNAIPDARDADEYRRVLGELSSHVAAGG